MTLKQLAGFFLSLLLSSQAHGGQVPNPANVTAAMTTNHAVIATGAQSIGDGGGPPFIVSNQSANTVYAGPTTGAATTPAFRALVAADVPANIRVRSFGASFGDPTGSALTSGKVAYFTVPYACTISAWNITVDAGTVTFDIWKIATGTAIPTVTNSITASANPALSTGTALHSTSMSGWGTSVTANDIVGIDLKTVATAKYAELDVECDQ